MAPVFLLTSHPHTHTLSLLLLLLLSVSHNTTGFVRYFSYHHNPPITLKPLSCELDSASPTASSHPNISPLTYSNSPTIIISRVMLSCYHLSPWLGWVFTNEPVCLSIRHYSPVACKYRHKDITLQRIHT